MSDDHPQGRMERGGLMAGPRAVWRFGLTEIGKRPPRVVRRLQRRGILACFTAAAVFFATVFFAIRTRTNLIISLYPFVFLVLAGIALSAQIYFLLKVRSIRRHAKSVDYYVCPECGYSLVDLDEKGTCPECGTAYTPMGLVEVWNRK